VFLCGAWKTIYELEEELTLKELDAILKAQRKIREHEQKFFAALQGVGLDGEEHEGPKTKEDLDFELDVLKAKAAAINKGEDPEAAEMNAWGMDYVVM
jgi:hypothetical protein